MVDLYNSQAHRTALVWTLENSDLLSLRINELLWIRDIFPEYTDIHCCMSLDGYNVDSWGFASNPDLALCKALAEALERLTMLQHGFKNSNGVAAHISQNEAQVNAASELRERDLFLCHFLTKTPFPKIAQNEVTWPWLESAHRWTSRNGLTLAFNRLGSDGTVCVVEGREANPRFGMCISASFKNSTEESARCGFIEAARRAAKLLTQSKSASLSLNEFNEIEFPSFMNHGDLALDLDYADSIRYLFTSPTAIIFSESQENSRLSFQNLTLKGQFKSASPFFISRASSYSLQNLWIGQTCPEKVNINRLSEFAGTSIKWEDIQKIPHPFC